MYDVTPRFLTALRESHVIAGKVTLLFPDAGSVDVPIEAGSVTIDRTAQNRRTGSVTIPWTLDAGENLGLDLRTLPLGGWALVYRGLRYADGSLELVQLGRFRVESVTWRTSDTSASLELTDRMAQVADEQFTATFAPPVGVRIAQIAIDIVQQVFPDIGVSAPYDPDIVLTDVFYDGSRADALAHLAEAASAEPYFDADGDYVHAAPAGSTAPVWTVDAGLTGVLVSTEESLARTGVYNGVLMSGQADATAAPVSALVTDDDPGSPTRWGGPLGKVARIETSTAVQNALQAAEAAQAILDKRGGLARTLTITSAPNPALEAGDVITVVFGDGRSETQLIDSVQIGLTPADAQQLQTRLVGVVSDIEVGSETRILWNADAWAELRQPGVTVGV
jgi:hypothetical protein